MKEEIFLNIIRESLPESAGCLLDDSAYIPEKDLILTQDTLIEDIHFRLGTTSPFYLGRKSIAVNLSDIAASGGIPSYISISLSMPKNIDENFVKEFYKGVNSVCREYKVIVIGGDLTAAEKIIISVCALGSGKGLIPANRSNAKSGDIVAVTGNFGSSAAGLYLLEESYGQTGSASFTEKNPEEIRTKFISSHINPVPKLAEGRKILETAGKPAMMDSSDGLADVLYKLCALSKVSMDIDFDKIPYDPDIFKVFPDEKTAKNQILFGGEDYELIAAISEEVYEKLKQEIPLKKIGKVKKADGNAYAYVKFKDEKSVKIDSEILDSGSFRHFE